MEFKSRFVRGVQLLALLAGLLLPFQPVAAAAPKPAITVGSFSWVIEATEPPWWGTARAIDVSWKGSPAYIELGFANCDGAGRCTWGTDMPSTRIAVNAQTVQPVSNIQLSVDFAEKGRTSACTIALRLIDRKGNAMGAPLLDPDWVKDCPESVHS
jgi:hypothetical protein